MNTKNILIFLSGIITGGTIGVLATKGYYKKKFDKMGEEYRSDLDEYYRGVDSYARGITDDDDEINPVNNEESRENGPLNQEKRNEIREKLKRNYRETTNYASFYKNKNITDPDDSENNREAEKYEPDPTPEEEANEEHEQNRHREPRIISYEKLGEIPNHYEEEALYYYTYDEVLTTDEGEVIEEPERLIGDALDKYDFRNNDEESIIVQNFALNKIYEISKFQAAYADEMNEE